MAYLTLPRFAIAGRSSQGMFMAVINIYTPGWFSGGTSTQFVANPWGSPTAPACDVWVLCTLNGLASFNVTELLAVYGIIEFEYLDAQGNTQQTTFGDVNNLSNVGSAQLPTSFFVSQMLSVTLAILTYNVDATGTVTLFQWG
jgi:hypothetical protein